MFGALGKPENTLTESILENAAVYICISVPLGFFCEPKFAHNRLFIYCVCRRLTLYLRTFGVFCLYLLFLQEDRRRKTTCEEKSYILEYY